NFPKKIENLQNLRAITLKLYDFLKGRVCSSGCLRKIRWLTMFLFLVPFFIFLSVTLGQSKIFTTIFPISKSLEKLNNQKPLVFLWGLICGRFRLLSGLPLVYMFSISLFHIW
ncbi:hypothetical protein ACJX0J_016233, partial [Zea mays]